MRRRRVPLALVWPVALLLLVGLLAALQYRWLGEVSAAERAQMQSSLRSHADDFARDFDREIASVYEAMQTEHSALQGGDWKTFAADYDRWKAAARYPQLVRDVYFVREPDHQLLRFDAARRMFERAPWPAALEPVRMRLAPEPGAETGHATGGLRVVSDIPDSVIASVPALVVALPAAPVIAAFSGASLSIGVSTVTAKRDLEATAARLMSFRVSSSHVIALLDRNYIQNTVLPDLAARYFPEVVTETSLNPLALSEGYRLAIVPIDDALHPLYARGLPANATIDRTHADADASLFSLRPDLLDQMFVRDQKAMYSYSARGTIDTPMTASPAGSPPARGSASQLSFVVASPRGEVLKTATGSAVFRGAWQLVLQHSAGSLDAAVGQARLRNLTMSFGVLALLAVSVGLIAINAQRAQRLASQQMDFVATVSHELRTPLAVIRSAAQNLSAGVIHDAAQAKRYGDLIDAEGKRLTDMVEQVLEFAGLAGNRRPPSARAIDVVSLVHDVAAASKGLLDSEQFTLDVRAAEAVRPVAADEAALRRALNNLVSNAVKYAAEGRWIGIAVDHAPLRGSDGVQISVSDHGQGIEPEDLPHIFEPFYRGRYATERQIHGNGLGLSLVKRIADAHGGRVTVKSVPGEGTTFTLHLPAAAPDPAMNSLASPEAHGSASA